MTRTWCRAVVALVVVALTALAASPNARARVRVVTTQSPMRVLFIGNSYTRANDLPHTVQRIAAGVPRGSELRVTSIANPGWDLARHWLVPETRQTISQGGFTHVVLQGHSLTALHHRDEFEGYARLFDDEIERIGARTILYETWARRPGSRAYRREHITQSPVQMQAEISECYFQLARDIGADVAPAGRAFFLALQRLEEDADLYRSDGAHPNRNGTFLAGLVLYATITSQDPRESRFRPYPMSRRLASELRDVAYHAVFGTR